MTRGESRACDSDGGEPQLRPGDQRKKGWNVPFEEWVVAHAQISSKPHKAAKLEDTLTFFHQLSTLVSSGTPLLQALKIAAAQCESIKLRRVLEQIVAKVSAGSSFHSGGRGLSPGLRVPVDRSDPNRRGQRQDGPGAGRAQQADPRFPRDQEKGQRRPDVSHDPDLRWQCIAVTVMLWMVVPAFAKMFKDMDAKLPAITQFVVDASDYIVKYGITA